MAKTISVKWQRNSNKILDISNEKYNKANVRGNEMDSENNYWNDKASMKIMISEAAESKQLATVAASNIID